MSPRSYARRFLEKTGTTPRQWLCAERVRACQRTFRHMTGAPAGMGPVR